MVDTKDLRSDRHVALDTRSNVHHIGGNWAMGRDDQGNAVIVPNTRITRTPPSMSRALRSIVVAIWMGSISLVLWAFITIGPKVPKALDWVSDHLGEAVVNATTTGSPAP